MESARTFLIGDNVFGFEPGQHVGIEMQGGSIELVTRLQAPDAVQLLELEGGRALDYRTKLVLPGLVDAHVHAIATGMLMQCVRLTEVATLDELAEKIKSAVQHAGQMVRLSGLDSSRLQAGQLDKLDREWLGGLVPDRAMFVKGVEGHSSWFNTAAWDQFKIDTYIDEAGVEASMAAEMRRSGKVHGRAYQRLTTLLYDSFSFEERRRGMELVISSAHQAGLVGLHCLEGYGAFRREDFELILELDGRDEIDLTLYCRDATPAIASELGVPRFGGCWCLDGAIGAHSAALNEPYADKPGHHGELYFSDEELSAWFEAGLGKNMQPCVHAIGDRALEQAVRVLSGLAGKYDLHKLRPRVDHFILGTTELAQQAASLGIVSAMQPAFDARWGGDAGGYATRLGEARALDTNPLGTMQRAGLRIAGSSDSYITSLDPIGGMLAAMNHHNPKHRLDFDAAVKLFCEGPAYLGRQEASRGKFATGHQADFTVVNGDRTLEAAQIEAVLKAGVLVCQPDQPR